MKNETRIEKFTEDSFWKKLAKYSATAGFEVVEKALWLYYAYKKPEIPAWAKRTIYGALLYFIIPFDAVTDLLPGIGYSDDLGILMLAVGTVAVFIDDDVKRKTKEKLEKWF